MLLKGILQILQHAAGQYNRVLPNNDCTAKLIHARTLCSRVSNNVQQAGKQHTTHAQAAVWLQEWLNQHRIIVQAFQNIHEPCFVRWSHHCTILWFSTPQQHMHGVSCNNLPADSTHVHEVLLLYSASASTSSLLYQSLPALMSVPLSNGQPLTADNRQPHVTGEPTSISICLSLFFLSSSALASRKA